MKAGYETRKKRVACEQPRSTAARFKARMSLSNHNGVPIPGVAKGGHENMERGGGDGAREPVKAV